MNTGHSFNFNGGDVLSKMGATWFVSYTYFHYIDKNHRNWEKISTAEYRKGIWGSSQNYHKEWLEQIVYMSDKRLNKNQIGVDSKTTKSMARQLLQIL